jgi:hypothetical protein
MLVKIIIFLLSTILLLSCRMVEIYDYTHEPTHHLRDRIRWKSGDILVPHYTNEAILFIPNLRTFSLSHASPRYIDLYAYSMQSEKFSLARVILINDDTKYKIEKKLNHTIIIKKKLSGRHIEYKHFYKSIELFEDKNINYKENFSGAKNLTLKIYYRYPNSYKEKEKIFKIKLKKNKEIAWPT